MCCCHVVVLLLSRDCVVFVVLLLLTPFCCCIVAVSICCCIVVLLLLCGFCCLIVVVTVTFNALLPLCCFDYVIVVVLWLCCFFCAVLCYVAVSVDAVIVWVKMLLLYRSSNACLCKESDKHCLTNGPVKNAQMTQIPGSMVGNDYMLCHDTLGNTHAVCEVVLDLFGLCYDKTRRTQN